MASDAAESIELTIWIELLHQKGEEAILMLNTTAPETVLPKLSTLLGKVQSHRRIETLQSVDILFVGLRLKEIGKVCNELYAFSKATAFLKEALLVMREAFKVKKLGVCDITVGVDDLQRYHWCKAEGTTTFSPQMEVAELLHCFTHSAVFTIESEEVFKMARAIWEACFKDISLMYSTYIYNIFVDIFFTIGTLLIDDTSQDLDVSIDAFETAVNLSNNIAAPKEQKSLTALARVKCHLGYCYMVNKDAKALDCLVAANELWKQLEWPIEESENVLKSMTYCVEAELELVSERNCSGVAKDMIEFQKKLTGMKISSLQVADAFDYLGRKAQNVGNLQRAEEFHGQALMIHEHAFISSPQNRVLEQVERIADCQEKLENLRGAIATYSNVLRIFKEETDQRYLGQIYMKMANLSLELLSYDELETYHNKALEFYLYTTREDQQLREILQMRLASWYFVREKHDKGTDDDRQTREKGNNAFVLANNWTSYGLSCIYYACHLFGDFKHRETAMQLLHDWYPKCSQSRYLLYFDEMHKPVLNDDLRNELDGQRNIMLPAAVVSLYFTFLGRLEEKQPTANVLSVFTELESVIDTRIYYEGFRMGNYAPKKLKAICLSLIGYCHMHLHRYAEARSCFKKALKLNPDYSTAKTNVELCHDKLEKRREELSQER